MTLAEELSQEISQLSPAHEKYAVRVVDFLLDLACRRGASDIHLLPQQQGKQLVSLFRVDGILETAGILEGGVNIVTRLKVLANLLTYKTDLPQEGRIRREAAATEIRVSTFPTVQGEKAVVRLFIGSGNFRELNQLGYPAEITLSLENLLDRTSGLLLTCGPAGSGKTTFLYAALREILKRGHLRSICTLEDPVEAIIPGVSQSQVKPDSDFTYERGLMSLLRQDPDVIMVGEIRDHLTAETVFQASLTGHLVLSTFHAGRAADAIGRLIDMQIEPYIIRSGLAGVLAQRLLRRACPCRQGNFTGEIGTIAPEIHCDFEGNRHPTAPTDVAPPALLASTESSPGQPFPEVSICSECRKTGYLGRVVVAELMLLNHPELCHAILRRDDVQSLSEIAAVTGMVTLLDQARRLLTNGTTTLEECFRVFGPEFRSPPLSPPLEG